MLGTVGLTVLDSHAWEGRVVCVQTSEAIVDVRIITTANNLVVSIAEEGASRRCECGRWSGINSSGNTGLRGTSGTLHISGCGGSRAGSDANATRKLVEHAFNTFANLRRLHGAVVRKVRVPERVEHRAVIECTRVVKTVNQTVANGALQYSIVPSILEITVEAISSGIALREDEATAVVQIGNLIDCIVGLKEKMREHERMGRRTDSVIDLGQMCNMAVVGFVQVLTIPASLEVDLSAKTTDTHARISR